MKHIHDKEAIVSMMNCSNKNLTDGLCDALSPPLNGKVATDTLLPGGMAVYTCNEGYNMYGTDTRVCEGGIWSESAPICRSKLSQ